MLWPHNRMTIVIAIMSPKVCTGYGFLGSFSLSSHCHALARMAVTCHSIARAEQLAGESRSHLACWEQLFERGFLFSHYDDTIFACNHRRR